MKKEKKDLGTVVLVSCIVLLLLITVECMYLFPSPLRSALRIVTEAGIQLASVIVQHNFRSVAEIKSNYENADAGDAKYKVRILLVPGHEPGFGGGGFGTAIERDMNVMLAQELQEYLQSDSHFKVFISRDSDAWSPTFAKYFTNKWNTIAEWKDASREDFSRLVSIGSTTQTYASVGHNTAPSDVATRLYGLTKWSNEHNIDIVIHIHFNDNPRSNTRVAGKYSGFALYVPASQYGNSTTTKAIAGSLFDRLAQYNPVSDLKGESRGVIDEPELIAIGANNTADAASMLIEYAYIYEPQFQDQETRDLAIKDLAFQTYLGLQDFFEPEDSDAVDDAQSTALLPYSWKSPMTEQDATPADVFALQTALMTEGMYPPPEKSKNECPRTGIFGPCTRASLQVFQNKYDITGETGIIGQKTLEVLHAL